MVIAQGGDAEARLHLTAEVTGQSELTISAPDGRLSGQAQAGRETPLEVILRNNGIAPAQGVELSAPLPFSQSLLLIWPYLAGLIAATILLFAFGYLGFRAGKSDLDGAKPRKRYNRLARNRI